MQRRRSQRASEKDVDGRDEPGHDGMIQCERVRISGATSLGPVFDAGLTRRPGALLKWHWPLSARTFATALPFASMFPCWQGRERFAPSIRIRWRGSKTARACAARACALNVSGAWPLPLTPVPSGKFRKNLKSFRNQMDPKRTWVRETQSASRLERTGMRSRFFALVAFPAANRCPAPIKSGPGFRREMLWSKRVRLPCSWCIPGRAMKKGRLAPRLFPVRTKTISSPCHPCHPCRPRPASPGPSSAVARPPSPPW